MAGGGLNMTMQELAAIVWMAGFVIGLGAVTVIECVGYLGQRSSYWNEATIRTHKVTKPLIWLGLFIAVLGGGWYYTLVPAPGVMTVHLALLVAMVINGLWLTFWISPRLLERERQGRAKELLPKSWKVGVTLSFFISIITWWTALALAVRLIAE